MDANKEEGWAVVNRNDTIFNGLVVTALVMLVLQAASPGTVEVPMPNAAESVINDTSPAYPFG